MRSIAVSPLEPSGDLFSPRGKSALVVGILTGLYCVAILFIARRAMGAFTAELSWQALTVAAIVSLAIVVGLRILWRQTFPDPTAVDPWIGWGGTLTLLLVAGGLSFPLEGRDWVIWVPALLTDQWLRKHFSRSKALSESIAAKTPAAIQQITRIRRADGGETVCATLLAEFVADQRTATVYLGFCPPLGSPPELKIETFPGAECRIVQAFPHGVRIDVRLPQAAREPTSVTLNLTAEADR